MALSEELITANETLKGLSPEQIAAITELSKNDESTVIGTKIGELHGGYDKDVLDVTGIAKNNGEKSYDYVKRVLGDFKAKASSSTELTSQITTLKGEVDNYKKLIAEGKGSEAIAQQLKDAQKELSDVRGQYDAEKQTWDSEKNEYTGKLTHLKVSTELEKGLVGMKFKASIPASVQNTMVEAAKSKLLSAYKPDWDKSAEGKEILIFRDANGNKLNNPENKLNPYTASELLSKELKDILDDRKAEGGGTNPPTGGSGSVDVLDLSGATTQIAADESISKYLLAKGLVKTDPKFAVEKTKIRKENEVDKLPIR